MEKISGLLNFVGREISNHFALILYKRPQNSTPSFLSVISSIVLPIFYIFFYEGNFMRAYYLNKLVTLVVIG